MNIEQAIQGLTEAVTKNTEALNAILAASATVPALPGVPYTEPEAKPAKVKREKAAPAPEPTPEPEAEPEPEQDTDEPVMDLSRDEWLKKIKVHVREKYAASGDKLLAKKQEFEAIRATFKVKLADDLTDEQFPAFWAAIQAL